MTTSTIRRFGRRTRVARMPPCSLLLVLGLVIPAPAVAQHFPPEPDLELMLRYLVEDGETPGIVLGVLEPDGSTKAAASGSGGPDAGRVGPRSVFELGALTMTFTATLLAEMVARGEVALTDPVSGYLPEEVSLPTLNGYRITLGDLATHRSGLPAGPQDPYSDMTVEDLYEIVSRSELERPGRRYEFSFLGYGLLGQALARAAGMSFRDLLRERVLEPLGMDMTGYALEGDLAEWTTRGHADGAVVRPSFAAEAMRGATGLRSNAEDMLVFLKANVGPPETDLERAMRMAQEIRIHRGRPDEDVGYGFSWRTYSVARQPPIVTHAGGTPGFSSLMAFDPEKGIGTVLLANTRAFDDWIGRNILFPDPPWSKERMAVDPATLRQYEGTYKPNRRRYSAAHDRGRFFIRLEDEGFLTYQARGVVRTRLYAESDSSFYMLRGPYTVTFHSHGDDVRMVIHVDEREPAFRATSWTTWKEDEETPPPAVVAGNEGSWRTWGPGIWALIILLALAAVALVLRPLWQGARVRAATAS